MLLHATVNTVSAGVMFPLFSGAPLILLWWVYGLIWLCARSRHTSLQWF